MRRFYLLLFTFVFMFLMISCGNDTKEMDYEQTKRMVVDILQTDEGKKALQEIISDDKMKQHLILESDVVKEAISKTLVSEKGAKMWQKLFEDPAFVGSFNQAIAEEQKKMIKGLMNDAEFQKQMLELLQNPEITNQTLTLMKSQQFREHLEETIQQTLESPLYQAKIQQLLLKAAENQQKSGEGSGSTEKSDGSGGSQQGGEQSGGGDEMAG